MTFRKRLPAHSMKTYGAHQPVQTHTREATCDEVDCVNWREGWIMKVNESDPRLGAQQGQYIRYQSGKAFKTDCTCLDCDMHKQEGYTVFHFYAGQQCFGEHRVSLERPQLFIVRDGDSRGNPRGTRPKVHKKAEYWVEDFAEHQEKIKKALEG